MRVPSNLLKKANGPSKQESGVALFSVVLIAIAGLGGLLWGAWTTFAHGQSVNTVCSKAAADLLNRFIPPVCTGCGMG